MEGVKEVRRLDDQRLHWRASIGGKEKKWTAKIIEQIPDHRIAWKSESGEYTSGQVDFARLGTDRTKVALEISYDPEGRFTYVTIGPRKQDEERATREDGYSSAVASRISFSVACTHTS